MEASKDLKKLNSSSVERISQVSKGKCCACLRLGELLEISKHEFIGMMKSNYYSICNFKLEESKIKSWEDEYEQLTEIIIPTLAEYRKSILNFHIIFEMKLHLIRSDLSIEKFIYSDAVIVGDNGFVVLEFKQRDKEAVEPYWKEALKYIKRLRFHKIGCRQKYRFTYMVCTKEKTNGTWICDYNRDLWFGNSESVARNLVSEFFDKNGSYSDIEEWINAGFWQKKKKHRKNYSEFNIESLFEIL